jgi:hypothetical protein
VASEVQIAANRQNAKRSTGPRTVEGKHRSAQNATKHGLTAEAVLLPGEDREQLHALLELMRLEFGPFNPLQQEQARRATFLMWRLRRVPALEIAIFNWASRHSQHNYQNTDFSLVLKNLLSTDLLRKLTRYESALARELRLVMNEIRLWREHEQRMMEVTTHENLRKRKLPA